MPGDWGNAQIDGPNNGVRPLDREMILGGSALTPIDSFRSVLRLFHKDICKAGNVWSLKPVRLMGLNKGEILAGRDADLMVLDDDLNLPYTIVSASVVHNGPQP